MQIAYRSEEKLGNPAGPSDDADRLAIFNVSPLAAREYHRLRGIWQSSRAQPPEGAMDRESAAHMHKERNWQDGFLTSSPG
jgi:hypothetical protein